MRVTITPEKAKTLLVMNTKNRKLSRKLVQKYASDMAAGRWPYNGDPIRVSVSNVLLDGQHRLEACIAAGEPFESELIEGLPDEVQKTIDGGRKRSAADVVNIINGGSMSTLGQVAAARQVLNYLEGVRVETSQSTPAIIDFIDANPDLVEKHQLAKSCEKIIPASVMAATLFLGTRAVGMDKTAMRFVDPLAHGEGLASGDPRLALRNVFISSRIKTGAYAKAISPAWAMAMVIQCWNAYVLQRELKSPRITPSRKATTENIVGAPPFGAGVDNLKTVKIHAARAKLLRPEDDTEPSRAG